MKKCLIAAIILLLIAALAVGCYGDTEETSTVEEINFRFLISDEVMAITEFSSLKISIDKIGINKAGRSGNWIEIDPAVTEPIDLVTLQGLNAMEIWSGKLSLGQYTKVFIYIDDIYGVLKTGEDAKVWLPTGELHGELQMTIPFVITGESTNQTESTTSFVYDLSVIKAGSTNRYLLGPQPEQSGAIQSFHEIGEGDLTIQVEGLVEAGEIATINVYHEGDPVNGVTVKVNDEELETLTDVDGKITFVVPWDNEIKIKAELDELEGELEINMERERQLEDVEEMHLTVVPMGVIAPGEILTIYVSNEEGAIEGAYVEVNDDELDDKTDGHGTVTFIVPQEGEVIIKAFYGNSVGELDIELV